MSSLSTEIGLLLKFTRSRNRHLIAVDKSEGNITLALEPRLSSGCQVVPEQSIRHILLDLDEAQWITQAELTKQTGIPGRQIRRIIRHLVMDHPDVPIISSTNGFRIAASIEMMQQAEKEIDDEINSMIERKAAIVRMRRIHQEQNVTEITAQRTLAGGTLICSITADERLAADKRFAKAEKALETRVDWDDLERSVNDVINNSKANKSAKPVKKSAVDYVADPALIEQARLEAERTAKLQQKYANTRQELIDGGESVEQADAKARAQAQIYYQQLIKGEIK